MVNNVSLFEVLLSCWPFLDVCWLVCPNPSVIMQQLAAPCMLFFSWKPAAGWAFCSVGRGQTPLAPLLTAVFSLTVQAYLSVWGVLPSPLRGCAGCRNKSTTNWLVHPCDLYWTLLVITSILLCLRERKWIFLILWLENWCLWARWIFVFGVDVHWAL